MTNITKCIFSLANPWFLFSHPGCVSSPVCLCSLQPSQNLIHRPGHYTKVGATLVGGGGSMYSISNMVVVLVVWACIQIDPHCFAWSDILPMQGSRSATPVLRHRLKKKKSALTPLVFAFLLSYSPLMPLKNYRTFFISKIKTVPY